MNFETAKEIELAVAEYFDPRRCVIVPNVWWGMGLYHECDLFVLTQSGYCYEVEIKISRSDLKADLKKRNGHRSEKIRKLYFALPARMQADIEFIPEHAGVLMVGTSGAVQKVREAKIGHAVPLDTKARMKLAHLGTMRIWTLKKQLLKQD